MQDLIVTADMHERKRRCSRLADSFVALPGGVGTLEELVEQLTWAQLGHHEKPVLVANIDGFWDALSRCSTTCARENTSAARIRFELLVADSVADILPMLQKAAEAVPEEAKDMTTADRSG